MHTDDNTEAQFHPVVGDLDADDKALGMLATHVAGERSTSLLDDVRDRRKRGRAVRVLFALVGKSRAQFTLRTLLVFAAVFASVCALVKCEAEARKEFAGTVSVVELALKEVEPKVDRVIERAWLSDAEQSVPGGGKSLGLPDECVVDRVGGYIRLPFAGPGSSQSWRIVRSTHPLASILARMPIKDNFSEVMAATRKRLIDVEVVCVRPKSLLPGRTMIYLVEYGAPKNRLLVEPLTAELDRRGLHYETRDAW